MTELLESRDMLLDLPDFEGQRMIAHRIYNISSQPMAGVYFLCLYGEIIYIGQSGQIFCRLGQHLKGGSGTKQKEFDSVFWIEIDDLCERNKKESFFIQKLKPIQNYCLFKRGSDGDSNWINSPSKDFSLVRGTITDDEGSEFLDSFFDFTLKESLSNDI